MAIGSLVVMHANNSSSSSSSLEAEETLLLSSSSCDCWWFFSVHVGPVYHYSLCDYLHFHVFFALGFLLVAFMMWGAGYKNLTTISLFITVFGPLGVLVGVIFVSYRNQKQRRMRVYSVDENNSGKGNGNSSEKTLSDKLGLGFLFCLSAQKNLPRNSSSYQPMMMMISTSSF